MEALIPVLLEYGLQGVIITVLGWAYWQERKEGKLLQEKRLEEAKEFIGAYNNNTQALQTLSRLIEAKWGD